MNAYTYIRTADTGAPLVLNTPLLQNITTFDPAYDYSIEFSYTGNQIFQKKIIITDNATSRVVYEGQQLGMKLSYLLPAGTLLPGQYLVKLQVLDNAAHSSEWSSPVLFHCFTTPHLQFDALSTDVHSANLPVTVTYTQAESEKLKEYTYRIYDYNKQLLKQSDTFYSYDTMSYTFYGLKNEQTYFIQCFGQTTHGMNIDTGLCRIYVSYALHPNNVLLQLKNHEQEGYISISSGIIDIGYELDNENYKMENGELILINNRITYNSGFEIEGNFSIFLKARRLPMGVFFHMPGADSHITLSIIETGGDYYCKLAVTSAVGEYQQYAKLPKAHIIDTYKNLILDTDGNALTTVSLAYEDSYSTVFELKRKDKLYDLNVYYETNGILVIE